MKKTKGSLHSRMFVRWDGEGRRIGILFSIVYNSSETLKDNPAPFMMGKGEHGCNVFCIPLLYAYIP